MELGGITAVVTGGASGLGHVTSSMLMAHGANVAILDLNEDSGKKLEETLGKRAAFFPLDVTNEISVKDTMQKVEKKFGKIEVLVNCAGIGGRVKTLDQTDTDPVEWFERHVRINLNGTYNVIRWAAPLMKKNETNENGERGVIVNVSSIAALEGQVGHTAYSSAKGGVISMTLPLAREFSEYGIRVMGILPGFFDTPMIANLPEDVLEHGLKQIPFPRRKGRPEEFASLVIHIIQNAYLNGECIRIDAATRGGFPG